MKVNNKIIFLSCFVAVLVVLFFPKSNTRHDNFFAEYGNIEFKTNYSNERIWTHKEFLTQREPFAHKINVALDNCCSKIYCSSKLLSEKTYKEKAYIIVSREKLLGAREYYVRMRGSVTDIGNAVNCFYSNLNG